MMAETHVLVASLTELLDEEIKNSEFKSQNPENFGIFFLNPEKFGKVFECLS
jgi:hypothetical protein